MRKTLSRKEDELIPQPGAGGQAEADPPVGDEGREWAGLGEEEGKVPAGRESGEAVEPELGHIGADRGGGGQLRRHFPRRPRRRRHADQRPRSRDSRGGGGHCGDRHRRRHRGRSCGWWETEGRGRGRGVGGLAATGRLLGWWRADWVGEYYYYAPC